MKDKEARYDLETLRRELAYVKMEIAAFKVALTEVVHEYNDLFDFLAGEIGFAEADSKSTIRKLAKETCVPKVKRVMVKSR